MAQRFGGRFSPVPKAGRRGARARPARRRAVGTGRRNLLYVAALPLLITAFAQDAVGMAVDLAAAAVIAAGAFTLGEGLKAEAAWQERSVARRPAIPRKIMAAGLTGLGVFLAALDPADPAVAQPLVYALIALALQLVAFGLDPLTDKGLSSDDFQTDRVARAVDRAEAILAEMKAAIAKAGDRALERRVEEFEATARAMFRKVEEDPRDLTAARKYLGVYLTGARDATVKFADLYARRQDAQARADYAALLDDLEANFAARTEKLMEGDRADLDIEIGVLRDRLAREGVAMEQ